MRERESNAESGPSSSPEPGPLEIRNAGDAGHYLGEQLEALKGSTIMMVDDEPTTLEVLAAFLDGEGYSEILSTSDSPHAVEMVRQQHPDVLLLDLVMPKLGGFEILAALRQDPELEHVPVIILTSSVDAETKLRALELGATDFLAKPVDPSELALRIRNTLAAKAYRDRLAYYDSLTGLPNARYVSERLGTVLERQGVAGCAVLQIDLDRFKQVNDALGRAAGDQVVQYVAERLEGRARPGDRLARVGPDEFSMFLVGSDASEQATQVARRLLADLAQPIRLGEREVFVSASIGIALFPSDGTDLETLLENAAAALSLAKRTGGSCFQYYRASLNSQSLEDLSLEVELRSAADRNQLRLLYQPKIDCRDGRIAGAEALMRWTHPELGPVPPERFIGIAEQTDLIDSIGEWALRDACEQVQAWRSAGVEVPRIAVNVSRRQFRSGRFAETVGCILAETGVDGKQLVLEITESLLIEDTDEALSSLRLIKAMGLSLSLDDFGTCYSSLSMLAKFPLDELKIDRSFVDGLSDDDSGTALVSAIIGMSHSLGLSVVAEGVEKQAQLEFLEELGCDMYQGYLFSKPLAADDLLRLLHGAERRGPG